MHKFSLVIYLDENLTSEIKNLQQKFTEITGSRACMDTWEPHLTIGSGVVVKDDKLNNLYEQLQAAIEGIKPFNNHIGEYKWIDNWATAPEGYSKNAVFFGVNVSEQLRNLAEKVKIVTDSQDRWYTQPSPYMPHVTLAYNDLTKEGLEKAKEFMKRKLFVRTTVVDHIALAKEYDNGIWKEFKRFIF